MVVNLSNFELATGRSCTRTGRPFTRIDQCGENPGDDYGVFGVEQDNTDPTSMFYPYFSPLNTAPSSWSTIDLDQPYSRDYPSSAWKSKRIWRIKCDLFNKCLKKHRLPTSDEEFDMD